MTDILTRLREILTDEGPDPFVYEYLIEEIGHAADEIESLRARLAMPDGARRTACPTCGWTFGTHAPHCTEQR